MKVLSIHDLQILIKKIGHANFSTMLVDALDIHFKRWQDFSLCPRHATHYPQGVIELMPCADDHYYTFKYVNGHPNNPDQNKLCVAAVGLLADAQSGYPLLISEMTLLTALRTAATGVLGAKYLARENSEKLAIIGCGAQSEFIAKAFLAAFPLTEITYFDIDPAAMTKFASNLANESVHLNACESTVECIANADIIVTATAAKKRQILFEEADIPLGAHIHAMGGDCPGKTELSGALLKNQKVVVEYLPQSLQEGEVQQAGESSVYGELWEIVQGKKAGRQSDDEITIFDSVGFALEDYATLSLVYDLAKKYDLGSPIELIPDVGDPKDLYSALG